MIPAMNTNALKVRIPLQKFGALQVVVSGVRTEARACADEDVFGIANPGDQRLYEFRREVRMDHASISSITLRQTTSSSPVKATRIT
jgi:hypothetical protein